MTAVASRMLSLVRHGFADAFGELTDDGRRQSRLLGERFADAGVDAIWHSPLPRAAASAEEIATHLPGVPVAAAVELIDHVPYVPRTQEMPPSWAGFFDGYDDTEASAGRRLADALVERFARPAGPAPVHEVLITHAYPIAWLLRHALAAPPVAWLGLTSSANAGVSVIVYADGAPATVLMVNELSHLPPALRWTGFRGGVRP